MVSLTGIQHKDTSLPMHTSCFFHCLYLSYYATVELWHQNSNFWSKLSDLVNEVIFNNTLDGSVAVFWLPQNPQCYLCMVWGKCEGGNHFCVAQHWWSVVIIVRHSLKAGFLHHLSLANSKCSNNRLYFIVCSQGYMSAMRKSYWTFYKSQIKYGNRKQRSKCIKILNVDWDQHRCESKCRHLLPVWLLAI